MTTKASLSVEDLLQKLITADSLPSLPQLSVLSDLTRSELQRVRGLWSAIPEERRYQTVRALVQESYDNLHLHLGRLLRVAMEDESDRIRALAVEGLWEEVDEALIGPLVHLLRNDPSSEVRAAAAAALGRFVLAGELEEIDSAQAMRAEEALLSVLHSDIEVLDVQCRALESIAFSGELGVRQLIEDAYYSPYEDMRISSLAAMGRSADTRWRAAARTELEDPSPAIRAEAARACGELEAAAAVSEVIALLDDEEKSVRLAAIFALGRIGGKTAVDALQAVQLGEDPEETDAAVEALEEVAFYGDDSVPLFDEEETDWDDDLDW